MTCRAGVRSGEILQVFAGIVGDFLALIAVEEPGIKFLLSRLELGLNVILFADKDELACRRRVEVAEEIMHPEPEVLEVELWKVVPVDRVRIKVVFLEFPSKATPLLVFSPEESHPEKEPGAMTEASTLARDIIPKTSCCDSHK